MNTQTRNPLQDDIVAKDEVGPQDTVSDLVWAPNTDFRLIASSSWDKRIRIHEVIANDDGSSMDLKAQFVTKDPLLAIDWQHDMKHLYAGGVDQSVLGFDLESGKKYEIGTHNGSVNGVHWVEALKLVLTTSYDKTVKLWDARAPKETGSYTFDGKIYCSDVNNTALCLGLSNFMLYVSDINDMVTKFSQGIPPALIESPLGKGSQLNSIKFMKQDQGIATASNDGRSNLSNLTVDNNGQPKLSSILTFKAHKTEDQNGSRLYPINDCGFHPKAKNYYFTCGGEGNMYYWDFNAKNKIKSFNFDDTPVVKAQISPDGACMAYAIGYDWSKGAQDDGKHKNKLCVHLFENSDLAYNAQ